MPHPRLSPNALSTFPWSFEQDLALWSGLGLHHAGLLISKLTDDPEAKLALLDNAGIRACTLIAEAIEPSLRTSVSFVNTLRDAVDVAEETGLGLIVDFGNMWMERDFRETVARAMPHIALVQIGDVVIGSSGRPAPGGRVHVGEGELPLRRMLGDVLDAGYAGVFDLEVVPADYSADCDDAALRRGTLAAAALLRDMGV